MACKQAQNRQLKTASNGGELMPDADCPKCLGISNMKWNVIFSRQFDSWNDHTIDVAD